MGPIHDRRYSRMASLSLLDAKNNGETPSPYAIYVRPGTWLPTRSYMSINNLDEAWIFLHPGTRGERIGISLLNRRSLNSPTAYKGISISAV